MRVDAVPTLNDDRAERTEVARAGFIRSFGVEPEVLSYAPGRVNLIGEHVDYCNGLVCPFAIGLGCAVAIGPARSSRFELHALDLEQSATRERTTAVGTSVPGDWAGFVSGLVASAQDDPEASPSGICLALTSSVPQGGGLSSSAAVAVAVLLAAGRLAGARRTPTQIAQLAQQAEHSFLGTPCGIMDPLVIAHAQAGCACLLDCQTIGVEHLALPDPADAAILLFASGVRHALNDGAYANRRAACESAAAALGVRTLRDVSPDDSRINKLPAAAPGEVGACEAALHATTEIERVRRCATALLAGDLAAAGQLLTESHASLRDVLRVSRDEVDVLQRLLTDQPGVLGARMTGGGFGGSCVALVERGSESLLARRIRAAYQAQTGFDCSPVEACACDGARVMMAD